MHAHLPDAAPPTALVLGGGQALGAFQAGACRVLHDAGVRPDWVVGTSIGAVNAVLIAGNAPERRTAALREFWSQASLDTGWARPWGEQAERAVGQAQSLALGTPPLFGPAWPEPGLDRPATRVGLYELDRLRTALLRLVDFDLINRGRTMRVTVVTTDLETGEEVLFDSRDRALVPEHVMASAALPPEVRPLEVDGRLLGDGGLVANLPIDVVAREPKPDRICWAVDLMSPQARPYRSLGEAAVRRLEMLMAVQSRLLLETVRLRGLLRDLAGLLPPAERERPQARAALEEARRADLKLVRLVCRSGEEPGTRTYDYSEAAIRSRWLDGERTAMEALDRLAELQAGGAVASWRVPSASR